MHHVMVSVPKNSQTKHSIYSPDTRVLFKIFIANFSKNYEPYVYCFHTNYFVLYKRVRATVLSNLFLYNCSLYIYTYIGRYIYIHISVHMYIYLLCKTFIYIYI